MQAYFYNKGEWTAGKDLIGVVESAEFNIALDKLGFVRYSKQDEIISRIGKLVIHSRDTNKAKPRQNADKPSYDFLCIVSIASAQHRIWITDLPSLIQLMSEMNASYHPKELAGLFSGADSLIDFIRNHGFPIINETE